MWTPWEKLEECQPEYNEIVKLLLEKKNAGKTDLSILSMSYLCFTCMR